MGQYEKYFVKCIWIFSYANADGSKNKTPKIKEKKAWIYKQGKT